MPTQEHDIPAELFRWCPRIAAELLGEMGFDLPDVREAQEVSESCTDHKTSEYMADAAVLLDTQDGPWAVVVEIQSSGKLKRKRFTWPLYLATLRARHECPTILLVIAADPAIAEACADTIETGHPGHRLTPLVLRPEHVPLMTDPNVIAADPAMGVLSAMFHGDADGVAEVAFEATTTIARSDDEVARRYYDYVSALLPDAARKALETMMKTQTRYYSEAFRAVHAEGEAKGEARMIQRILDHRGIELTEEQRQRISGCTDLEQLEVWADRALTVTAAEELFACSA